MMQGHKPPEIRYAVRIENNGPWTVFDTFIDKPAELGSRLATQMQMSGAEEIYGRPQLHPSGKRQWDNSLKDADMDRIKSLSIYRESLISSLWTLKSFPDELREFAAKERLYLEGAVKVVEADIRFYRDAEENAERALSASNDPASPAPR